MRWLLFTLVLIGCPVAKDSGTPTEESGTTDSMDSGIDTGNSTALTDADGDGYYLEEKDCDDTNPDVHPGAPERCNGIDDNCIDGADENVLNTYYIDGDGDGYGDSSQSTFGCEAPDGYAAQFGDCNDSDPIINPGAVEDCTTVDDLNCDGKAGAADQDGDQSLSCNDCDDTNPAVHPGAQEVCDPDDVDEDCSGAADNADSSAQGTTIFFQDSDRDSFGASEVLACDEGTGLSSAGGDCDDTRNDVYPGAVEDLTDGVDNDCDGFVDIDPAFLWYTDADGDGYGDPATAVYNAVQPPNTVSDSSDCDDTDASIFPGSTELADGLDNDCNGIVDDGLPRTWYYDTDYDGYGDPNNSVVDVVQPAGTVADNTDCDDRNPVVNPGGTEVFDNFDNNCNGQVDEGFVSTWYLDVDQDGFGDPNNTATGPNQPPGTVTNSSDCDDTNALTYPGASEIADGLDNNCDGQVDEGLSTTWYADADADGFGDAATAVSALTQPFGYVSDNTDCDDSDFNAYPGATEVYDGADNNCNGQVDEGFVATTWYQDSDGDGFGNASVSQSAVSQPAGYVADKSDCNDSDSKVNPKATEVYDSVDNNCNGQVDEGFTATTWYQDSDGDGYGNASVSQSAVSQPSGYVADKTDCDDTKSTISPKATEVYDSIDNNCDGQVDEGFSATTWYQDSDGDGYGNASVSQSAVTQPSGYVADKTDCDDTKSAINPKATEVYDSVDNNCNGQIDEGFVATTWYQDSDGDKYGNASVSQSAVSQPSGYVADSTDCNDKDATIHPGASEKADGLDNNCDGKVDEGLPATSWYDDLDGDGYGDPNTAVSSVLQPSGMIADGTDCDDGDGAIHPGATEVSNGLDDNCDGQVDEGFGTPWYLDVDGDGHGGNTGAFYAVNRPTGYAPDNTDCNDADASVYTGAPEMPDSKDNDCNGNIDEGSPGTNWPLDLDGDGYGDATHYWTATTQPSGTTSGDNTDCDDASASVNPGAKEVTTDSVDNDCDGNIDEGGSGTVWYRDSDGDTYGDPNHTWTTATQPSGYVSNKTDCNDTDAAINPVAYDGTDGVDNDCDGLIDEGASSVWYEDQDGDGYGNAAKLQLSVSQPAGYVSNKDDCDDLNSKVNPAAKEICDFNDNDCDSLRDEDDPSLDTTGAAALYTDADGDTFGDPKTFKYYCTPKGAGYVTNGIDCDDTNAKINPSSPEVVGNGKDDNCDGTAL